MGPSNPNPLRREQAVDGPYRCTAGMTEHVINLDTLREEDKYDAPQHRWIEGFMATGYIDPPIDVPYGTEDTLEIWHVDHPELTAYATYAKIEERRDGTTRYRIYGPGSLMRLGPLRHTREHDRNEQEAE